MRRPRLRRLLLGLAYALLLYPLADYLYWHRLSGAFNHR